MKKLFLMLSLVFSVSVFAEATSSVFPHVYNFGSNVQVQVWNNTENPVSCSGWVYITTQRGFRQSEYFYENVQAGMTSYRTYWVRPMSDRATFVHHSIYCY